MPQAEFSFEELVALSAGAYGMTEIACPLCGPLRTGARARRKVAAIFRDEENFIRFGCARCDASGYARKGDGGKVDWAAIDRQRAESEARNRAFTEKRLRLALYLWNRALPIANSIAEVYVRDVRGITCPLPPTLRFLPARGDHPPAMIALFGIDENDPVGVHITKLRHDGLGKASVDKAKVMVGRSRGFPIILSPFTDGLGLMVAEGIESALSAYQATGSAAWAAGSAGRMPALADRIPSYVESVTICAEFCDVDGAGERFAKQLAERLAQRRIEVLIEGLP